LPRFIEAITQYANEGDNSAIFKQYLEQNNNAENLQTCFKISFRRYLREAILSIDPFAPVQTACDLIREIRTIINLVTKDFDLSIGPEAEPWSLLGSPSEVEWLLSSYEENHRLNEDE